MSSPLSSPSATAHACRECGAVADAPRRLCKRCHRDQAILDKWPPLQRTLRDVDRAEDPIDPAGPCPHAPGTPGRAATHARRAAAGLALSHPRDNKVRPDDLRDDDPIRNREGATSSYRPRLKPILNRSDLGEYLDTSSAATSEITPRSEPKQRPAKKTEPGKPIAEIPATAVAQTWPRDDSGQLHFWNRDPERGWPRERRRGRYFFERSTLLLARWKRRALIAYSERDGSESSTAVDGTQRVRHCLGQRRPGRANDLDGAATTAAQPGLFQQLDQFGVFDIDQAPYQEAEAKQDLVGAC